ncbi:exopolyphosphatase [Microdochium nivale]|nr:exopolyphosphatase [Microdochium nivale]
MRVPSAAIIGALAARSMAAVPLPRDVQHQHPIMPVGSAPARTASKGGSPFEPGVGHFSEWSRETKRQFLIDWQAGKSSEWIIVQGNEGGDLDSMTAALTWAYHLQHATANTTEPVKAIALLQTPTDALDLRPENKIALDNSQMSSGHSDLLTIEELPEDPETLATHIKGIIIVDHPVPLRRWSAAPIISIFDHHKDSGAGPDAKPRIFEKVASCTTIVARQMLDELEALPQEYHLPHELLELILGAIAIDSGGLGDATDEDRKTSQRVLDRSNWRDEDLDDKMEELDQELGDAKKDLDHLKLRDLLRRDWKGDLVDTPSPRTPTVNLGFASIPYSLDYQITRTGYGELFDWFATQAAWTAQVGADISVVLNNYKVKEKDENGDKVKRKIREIVLVVRNDVRIGEEQADELFRVVKEAIEKDETLNVKPWHRVSELGRWQMAWTHERSDAGRKVIRPIVEEAVQSWD